MPPPPPPPQGVVETRRSKSAPRPTRSRAGATTTTGYPRQERQPRVNARSKLRGTFDEPAQTPTSNAKLRIHALRLLEWNSIDRSLLQTILCKRTAASYVAAYAESLVAEVSSSRSIVFFDWGCLCIIDEITSAYSNVDERHEEEAFEQFLDFLLKDVVYPCSSNDVTVVQRPLDEDRDSITLIFSGGSAGRRNPILNDVVYLEPTVEAEDRRKRALACALALSQSLALKHVELELQRWITESVNPLTLVLAQSGDVPDEEDTLRLYGRLHGFLHEVDGIGQALAMPADIDVESKAIYLMAYEYLEVEARLKVMQERFDITKASLSLFKSLRESSESTRKERIIIYLLVVCVLIAGLELLVKASRWRG